MWAVRYVVAGAIILAGVRNAGAEVLNLWYAAPAAAWNEGLLIGNGRMGGVVWGGVMEERIDLNEDTLWSGEPDYVVNPEARGALPEVRKLLLAGKFAEAQALVNQKMSGKESAVYLPLGDLRITFSQPGGGRETGAVREYRRELDLETAVVRVSYQQGGVRYTREIFASNPGRAIIVRLSGDQPGKISFTARLASQLHNEVKADAGTLHMAGRAPMQAFDLAHKSNAPVYDEGGGTEPKGMRFAAQLAAENEGGRLRVTDQGVVAENCDTVTLILVAETSYNGAGKSPSRQGKDEAGLCAEDLQRSRGRPYPELRAAHVADYQKLFLRTVLDLGHSAAREALPTDERIRQYQPGADPGLAALYYQFGRYLLISCSREGGQPANLQGLWNASLNPPWASNWTINCNTEINYWPVEAANLAECHLPLIEMVKELSVDGARVAREFYGTTGGWVAHHATDIWKFAEPCGSDARWMSFQCGGTWLCQDLWEHYAFSGDVDYLRSVWPVMKGAARFHLDTLMEEPAHHWLVTGPDINFENPWKQADGTTGSICMGPTANMQMLRALFENCVRATKILNIDAEFRAEIEKTLPRLPPMQVSPTTGQLQEYLDDWQRTAKCQALSSWGAICGHQITPRGTPALAAGLRKIFDGERWWEKDCLGSWEGAFQSNVYARLGDGDTALAMVNLHLQKAVSPNMGSKFIGHSNVFQIDGNLGQTAAIGEMLLQSHVCDANGVYEVDLLPALPVLQVRLKESWADGEVKGLRARGALDVDIAWKAGRLSKVRVTSAKGGKWRVRYGASVVALELRAAQTRELGAGEFLGR